MQHPPYSPALDTNDYWLFPKTQFAWKWRISQDFEDIQKRKKITMALKAIPKREFKKIFPTVAKLLD
jgi:hypothetical protein